MNMLSLAVAVLPVAAFAGSPMQQLGQASGTEMTSISSQFAAIRAPECTTPMIPRNGKDVFAQCPSINGTPIRQLSLPEAVSEVQACLNQTYAHETAFLRYGVRARAGKVVINPCPRGAMCVAPTIEQDGIVIAVEGILGVGDPVLLDLNYSLNTRGRRLLGYYAQVENKAALSIARQPKDVLDCTPPLTMQAWTLSVAADFTQQCLNKTYAHVNARMSYGVTARQGRFGVRACPEPKPGELGCNAMMEVEGIVITVDGAILTGDSVLEDLRYSLMKRDGRITGFFATLDNRATTRR